MRAQGKGVLMERLREIQAAFNCELRVAFHSSGEYT
jgi:hypothetical protein